MKKLMLFASALAGLFLAASCQQENLEPVAGKGQVTFTIEAPAAIQTKAIADGLKVDELIYEVWITGATPNQENLSNATRLYQARTDMKYDEANTRMYANITLDLVNDQNFTVLFWAQKSGIDVYNTNWLNAVTYKPNTADGGYAYAANDNRLDAFYAKAFVSDGATSTPTVTLRRPFAQVNLCTLNNKDAAQTPSDYNIALSQSKMRLDAVPTVFNVATSAATKYKAMEFVYNAVPSDEDQMITVNGKEYYYAGMNYVFAGANIALTYDIATKLNGTVDANVNNTIANVPLKENHRTNIVGNLLTSKVDYEIIVDAAFYEPAEYVYVWDGTEITAPEQVDENTYEISQASELAWLAAAVNGTLPETRAAIAPQDFAGKTFVLTENIDLGGHEWTPIGTNSKHFRGLFEGNGHIISNFKITEKHNGGSQAAFFGTVSGDPTFRNVTIQNAKVVYPGEGDFYGAALIGTAYGNVTIKNVTVKNCEISGNNKVAGLLAHDGVVSSLNIDNCHVLNSEIVSAHETDGGNVGGLIGLFQGAAKSATSVAPYGDHIIKNSSVKNTVIKAVNSTNSGKRSNGEFVACVTGKATLVINDCEVEGNTFTQNEGVTYVSPYGVFVGGDRLDDRKVTVIVDGKMMIDNGFTKEGNTFEVSNAAHFLKAANMVADGDVIKLLADVTFTEVDRTHNSGTWYDGLYYIGDKNFTIDLNNHTIDQNGAVNDYLLNFKNEGEKANIVTLKNGTVDAGTAAFCALCTSSSQANQLTINLENITLYNNISNGSTVKLRGGAVLNVNAGAKIIGKNSYLAIECVGSTVNIYDGAELYMNGTTSYNGCLAGVGYGGTMNVYGGYGVGKKGGFIAMTSGGTINVAGGEWIANTDGKVGDNSNLYVLTAQSNKYESGFAGPSIINVTGGTLLGGMDAWVLNNIEGEKAELNISGGNFNVNPTRFLATDYKAVEADGIWTVVVDPVAKVGDAEFASLEEAATAAKAGDTITVLRDATLSAELTLPANVTLNGNGKQINGTIYAGGNLTFAGHTKVTSFSASYYDRVITIGEGACLEITGGGRVSLAYGNTFNITGNVENAKAADKSKIQPSLIIPAGISITGGSDATMNVTNAYVKIGSTSSKNSAANGVFTLNFTNSIAEFTDQLTFAEPTSGKTPTFNLNITNSVLTTGTKLIAAAPKTNVKLDNSIVTLATYFRNSGKFEVVNGSVLTGSTIQFGENGGNDGELIVDASKVTINASSTGHALDGKGTGSITLTNGAEAMVTYYKGITVSADASSTFTGIEVQ